MKYIIHDTKYRFKSAFNMKSGAYVRTGILDETGKDTGVDPFMASYPHLIDVGIMGHCTHGKTGLCVKAGIECYQSGLFVENANMSVDDFRRIAKESRGRCNQLALGGRGDPDQHESFEEILKISVENQLVPNYTTSGYGMNERLAQLSKKYCGAVAVSWYRSSYTLKAIDTLIAAGVKTNIHYVLGNHTIDEAIARLKNRDFPKGINAIIFLLHKPAGQGTADKVLDIKDPRLHEFFRLIEHPHLFKVGMDSCTVPGAVQRCKRIVHESLDTCEGGRFSCYISADMKMVPCSFDVKSGYTVNLRNVTIEEAWNSSAFEKFRRILKSSCPDCAKKSLCLGGCPLMPEIVLCNDQMRSFKGE